MKEKKVIKKIMHRNNRGIALLSVLIAVSFVSIIGVALLYITYTNYMMKVMNVNSKENFYETDGELVHLTSSLRNVTMDGYKQAYDADNDSMYTLTCSKYVYDSEGNRINKKDEHGVDTGEPATVDVPIVALPSKDEEGNYIWNTDDLGNKIVGSYDSTYDVTALVNAAYPGKNYTGDASSCSFTKSVVYGGKTYTDTFTISSKDHIAHVRPSTKGEGSVFTLEDLTITQKSADGLGGSSNTIKTDIVFKTMAVPKAGRKSGVGECSMLMDSSITSTGDFTILNIYGDGYFAEYGNLVDYQGKKYTAPADTRTGGKAALTLSDEAKCNFMGDYMVIYGDIVLNDKSCLYISKGNLAVYGNIYLNDNSTLICAGNIFVLDGPLPGRTEFSDIIAEDGDLSAHLFPSDKYTSGERAGKLKLFKYIDVPSFKLVCAEMNLNNDDKSDDGIVPKISCGIENYNNSGNTFDVLDLPSTININGGHTFTTTYRGKQCGVHFNTADTINSQKNSLIFNIRDTQIREPSENSTILSKKPINIDQKHTIALTKVGSDVFDFLRIKSSEEGENPEFDSAVHKMGAAPSTGFGGGSMPPISAGDFLKETCNDTVNTVLLKSTGGGEGKTFINSLYIDNYIKDYEPEPEPEPDPE